MNFYRRSAKLACDKRSYNEATFGKLLQQKQPADNRSFLMQLKSSLCVLALACAAVVGVALAAQPAQAASVDQVLQSTVTSNLVAYSGSGHGGHGHYSHGYYRHGYYGHGYYGHGGYGYGGCYPHYNYRYYYNYCN